MTDLTVEVQAARAQIAATIPLLREGFRACWDTLYADKHRKRDHTVAETRQERDPRAPRCGSCEHADDHTPHCQRDRCGCRTWESWPSTVGWAEWTGPGQAEIAYTAATKELQRAHDCLGEIEDVPAHWASDALCKPGNRSVPMAVELVLQGVTLLEGALGHVTDDLAPPEASALVRAADHVGAALKAFDRAEDRLKPEEWKNLNQPRCAVHGCRVARHADGLCQRHYDLNRRGSRMACLDHDLEIVMDTGRPDPRLVVCRSCRRRWKLSRLNDNRVSTG